VAIVYPLSMPAVSGPSGLANIAPSGISLFANYVVAKNVSPYTKQMQGYIHTGTWWNAKVSLPSMTRPQAEPWIAFLAALRGKSGQFLLGDPAATALLGTASGPWVVNGANQTGLSLTISGGAGILKAGDYFQIGGQNLLQQSQDFENAAWLKDGAPSGPIVTADTTAAPDGSTTADTIAFPATGAAQFSNLHQQVAGLVTVGVPYTFSIWLKASSAVQVTLVVRDTNLLPNQAQVLNVTTAWQRFSLTVIPQPGASTTMDAMIYAGPSAGAVTIFAWGAQLENGPFPKAYVWTTSAASSVPSRLYKNLTDQSAGAPLDIFPALRESPANGALLSHLGLPGNAAPQGVFELDTNTVQWDIDSAKLYTLSFSATESI
jgi:hypothetical protein